MTDQWCVLLNTGTDFLVYGPMHAVEAQGFAAFMTDTVDPATPRKLHSPTAEMLAWYQHETGRNNKCPCGQGCESTGSTTQHQTERQ
jgi:hypothetical protein